MLLEGQLLLFICLSDASATPVAPSAGVGFSVPLHRRSMRQKSSNSNSGVQVFKPAFAVRFPHNFRCGRLSHKASLEARAAGFVGEI